MMQLFVLVFVLVSDTVRGEFGVPYDDGYEDYGIFGPFWAHRMNIENPCAERNRVELNEIKDSIRTLTDLVQDLADKLSPGFKRTEKPKQHCPEGFSYFPEVHACYKVIFKGYNWTEAGQKCQKLNPDAHLVSIASEEESQAVRKFLDRGFRKNSAKFACLKKHHANVAVWTSGQRLNETDCNSPFVWKPKPGVQIPFNFTNFQAGEPNCAVVGRETCMEINDNRDSAWNDLSCHYEACPLCEYDPQ